MEGSLAKSANKWIKAKGLKSSSIPISFIPFNKNKDNCDCGNKYSKTLLFNQKYCKKCISGYIKLILNNNDNITPSIDQLHNFYLFKWVIIDVIIYTDNSIVCNNHEDKDFDKYEIQEFRGCYIKDKLNSSPSKLKIDWIPYSQIKNLEKIAEGGFGIIYKANIDEKVVAVKGFLNSQDPSNDFLNELKSLYQCYDEKFEYNKLETLIEESNTDINEYITKEYELDIDDTQRDSIIQNSNIQYCSNSLNSETNPLRKRNIEELNVEIQDNGKHIKISDEIDKEIKE
ncbi:hypothetical protein RhiirA1_438458 [Rhizophagus irregularis]|uniref:Protein kinase domain-containing protein n=1 Tax=Rhizophagus irregularis TaxID=588596 RepID=A0A2N0S975_9GLOM|nr:hypothetical protein RhiirA1_438458 [Rhizophagus irregularis]